LRGTKLAGSVGSSSPPVDGMTLTCNVPRALFLAYTGQLARESPAAMDVAGEGSHHCVVQTPSATPD
jgi:hypothetical protein